MLVVYAGDDLALAALAERLGLTLAPPGAATRAYQEHRDAQGARARDPGSDWPRIGESWAHRVDGVTVERSDDEPHFRVSIPGLMGTGTPSYTLDAITLPAAMEEVDRLLPCLRWRRLARMGGGSLKAALRAL